MTILLFTQIVFVCLIGAMSPGPSMVVVINNTIFKNKINGIITALGHGFGIGIYAICAVIGIGLIIENSVYIFNIMRVLSIIFLFYLGITSITVDSKLNFNRKNFNGGLSSFFDGFAISILNPKILIWFIAIYAQFMSLENDIVINISLVLIASTVDATWYIILVNLISSKNLNKLIRDNLELLQKIIGYIFIIISLILLIRLFIWNY